MQRERYLRCDCDRLFSAPNATWGWYSHNERFFYGYTGFISTYNKAMNTDLPLYLRLVQVSRPDCVSAFFALSEFRKLYPNLSINTFISYGVERARTRGKKRISFFVTLAAINVHLDAWLKHGDELLPSSLVELLYLDSVA